MNSSSAIFAKWKPCVERLLIAFSIFIALANAKADPRDTLAPWPEEPLAGWGFDAWYPPMTPPPPILGLDAAQFRESWTGYALVRDGLTLTPVAIPVVDASSPGKTNFTTKVGSLRFWFSPDWSSGSLQNQGTNTYPRLLELISLYGNTPETLLALYFNPDGTAIYLSGQGVGGSTDFLSASIDWQLGEWHLLTVAYDGQQTSLFVDTNLVATGAAMPDVATWKQSSLALAVGSDIGGGNQALGQFDELCTFDSPLGQNDLAPYWKCFYGTTLLGPLGTPEEEQNKQRQLRTFRRALAKDGGSIDFPPEEDPPADEDPLTPGSTPSYPTNGLWLSIEAVSNATAYVTIHGTVTDTMYELLSRENLTTNAAWQSEGTWIGLSNVTPATVSVGVRTNKLFLWARSYQDTDGSGMPDWWQLQYFGHTGVDGYADPDGDGWVNLQEYQNGTHPTAVFNTPAAPQGVVIHVNTNGSAATISWLASGGTPTAYIVERYFNEITDSYTVSGTTYTDTTFVVPDGVYLSWDIPALRVRAQYPGGNSSWSDWQVPQECLNPVEAHFVSNPAQGALTLATGIPADAVGLRFTGNYYDETWGEITTNFTIAVGSFTNHMAPLPIVAQIGRFNWNYQAIRNTGVATMIASLETIGGRPWVDAREHMIQNMTYFLRAASTVQPFELVDDQRGTDYSFPENYIYSDYHQIDNYFDDNYAEMAIWMPLVMNNDLRNCVFSSTNIGTNGFLTTGFYSDSFSDEYRLSTPGTYDFASWGVFAAFPSLLSSSQAQWLNPWHPWALGVGEALGGQLTLTNNTRNYYGLKILSAKVAWPQSPAPDIRLLSAGGTTTNLLGIGVPSYYPEADQPVFQNNGYYFGHVRGDPLPGHFSFVPANASPLLIASVGDPDYEVAGYAKYSLSNGYAGKLAYLSQYFDKAYRANVDGSRSTNQTGFLSPYGEFFPTEPGKIFLTTKLDGVSTNIGECVVNVIKLQLDVNHDGTMNTSWTGPDNTSEAKPVVFWVNNDFDRLHSVDCNIIGLDCDEEEDDLEDFGPPQSNSPTISNLQQPDGMLTNILGYPFIPSMRDLEDYGRLWIPGLSNLVATLPSGYVAKLSLIGDGQIRLFRAIEDNGGTNYLFDEVTASNQVSQSPMLYVGKLTSSSSISWSPSNWGEHFIWCGVRRGKAELHLQILDPSQSVIGDTTAFLDLKDIKEMYERWTVGENGSQSPASFATNAVEDLPVGVAAFRYTSPENTNTPYILHVHGWNMKRWEKDRYGETAFKRLYWQGYQGRFGIFRWPTRNGFEGTFVDAATDANNYDLSEFNAWKSGAPLRKLLAVLDGQYPGQVRLTAHSMGNVVAGEALRTNTPLVRAYVAMQAAIPAHSYDSNAPIRTIPSVVDDETPNRYAVYWTNGAPCYFNNAAGADQYVDFYNTNDYALDKWQIDQNLKPADTLNYSFSRYNVNSNKFFRASTELLFPVDTHEIFSFCDESRCFALGAQGNMAGFSQLDLMSIWPVDIHPQPRGLYSAHVWHSAQFRSTNMKQKTFWQTLLGTQGFDLR